MQFKRDTLAKLLDPIHGWCTAEKAEWLAGWIGANHPTRLVEIGVFGGRSLLVMALALKDIAAAGAQRNGYVLGVDPYDPSYAIEEDLDPANREWWNTVDMEPIYQGALSLLCEYNATSFGGILRTSADNVAGLFQQRSLDLVHVDGCHSEKASTRDVSTWWPLIRIGGVMVLDDTDWPSVKNAKALLETLGIKTHDGKTWAVYERTPSDWDQQDSQERLLRSRNGV